jgi:hypothetical protein
MTLFRSSTFLTTALALALLVPRASALSPLEAEKGRGLVKQYADAIVSIELVVTLRISINDKAMPPQESKVDVNGTVLSPSGLTVTALSSVDPRGAMEAMRASRLNDGRKIEFGETEFKDVKLRLANGTEIPSAVVLKDPDLNFLFIAPLPNDNGPKRTFPFVALDREAEGALLNEYFFVTRAAKNLQRVPIVHATYVAGIVEKPRRMYLLGEPVIGVPLFDSSGAVLGLATQYLENGRPVAPVVITPSDVAELAKQAAAIKPEEKTEKVVIQPLPYPAPTGAAPSPIPAPGRSAGAPTPKP